MSERPLLSHLRSDFPASIVVFLVALPLCLGIALASGAPPLAGVIAGIVGGTIVGALSRSSLGVSGPAAGLAIIVLHAIEHLGAYELFLCSVVIAGAVQVLLGLARAGVLAYYFPSSVIKGMLAAIGVIIILKQVPHALGYNADYEGDVSFFQPDNENTLTALLSMVDHLSPGSMFITVVGLTFLLLWDRPFIRQSRLGVVPGPLLAVGSGMLMGYLFDGVGALALPADAFVDLPTITMDNVGDILPSPDFNGFLNPAVWKTGVVMAIVASLETLLCVEATDKLDPDRRVTPTNRELFAQGVGNTISGLIGGLPITQVIVRSSANIQSGGKTKMSAILHGFLLLFCLLLIPNVLRAVPLASLAAVLLIVGYKLARPLLFLQMWQKGHYQFVPFIITIVGVVFTDLLSGVMIGMAIGIFTILYNNYRVPFHFNPEDYKAGDAIRINLSEDVSFLNKASLQRTLGMLPEGAHVIIDASKSFGLDPDVEEIIRDAALRAPSQGVLIDLVGFEHETERPRPMTLSVFHEHVTKHAEERSNSSNERPAPTKSDTPSGSA